MFRMETFVFAASSLENKAFIFNLSLMIKTVENFNINFRSIDRVVPEDLQQNRCFKFSCTYLFIW